MKKCEACGAELSFALNPLTNGNIPLTRVPFKRVYTVKRSKGMTVAVTLNQELWVNHFENCSDPNRFSRKEQPDASQSEGQEDRGDQDRQGSRDGEE